MMRAWFAICFPRWDTVDTPIFLVLRTYTPSECLQEVEPNNYKIETKNRMVCKLKKHRICSVSNDA